MFNPENKVTYLNLGNSKFVTHLNIATNPASTDNSKFKTKNAKEIIYMND